MGLTRLNEFASAPRLQIHSTLIHSTFLVFPCEVRKSHSKLFLDCNPN